MTVFWFISSAVLVIIGLIGTFVPVLPGVPLICGGLALAAWTEGFTKVSVSSILLICVLGLLSYGLDFVAASIGVKRVGASKSAITGALLGSIIGCLLFPPLGLFIGPFVGAFVGELYSSWDLFHAGRVGVASFIGTIAGMVAKLGCVLSILIFFVWAYLV